MRRLQLDFVFVCVNNLNTSITQIESDWEILKNYKNSGHLFIWLQINKYLPKIFVHTLKRNRLTGLYGDSHEIDKFCHFFVQQFPFSNMEVLFSHIKKVENRTPDSEGCQNCPPILVGVLF